MTASVTYCRTCGVEVRRWLGTWRHTMTLGPVACRRLEPELEAAPEPEPEPEPRQ